MQALSPFQDLLDEHVVLLNELADLRSSIKGHREGRAGGLGGSGLLRDSLQVLQHRLRAHFRREEEVVFPEAKRMISEGARGADVFGQFFAEEAEDDMSAHATLAKRTNEMLELAVKMAQSTDKGVVARLAALADLAAGLLERHAAKEDSFIFPMIENSLTDQQVDEVRARLQQLASGRDLSDDSDAGLPRLGA